MRCPRHSSSLFAAEDHAPLTGVVLDDPQIVVAHDDRVHRRADDAGEAELALYKLPLDANLRDLREALRSDSLFLTKSTVRYDPNATTNTPIRSSQSAALS